MFIIWLWLGTFSLRASVTTTEHMQWFQKSPPALPWASVQLIRVGPPVDTRPQPSAKCIFKVGHGNEREAIHNMGSQMFSGAVAGEDKGCRSKWKLPRWELLGGRINGALSFLHQASASHAGASLCSGLKMEPYMAVGESERVMLVLRALRALSAPVAGIPVTASVCSAGSASGDGSGEDWAEFSTVDIHRS